ncbi:MAG: hypothetical protein IJO92_00735 [Clostridia bacterium]|nr:hypothetical protein [Clostridia bacterium]
MLKIPYNKDLILPAAPLGEMGIYPWDKTGYTPKATITMVYNEEFLRVRLQSPVTELTVLTHRDNGPVWEDNCLELFLAPYADHPDYINFECNPIGAMVIGKGAGRGERISLVSLLKPLMNVTATVYAGKGYEINYTVPLNALAEIYDRPLLQKGDVLRMNAYICGEATPIMHFGMLFPIDTPTPDFHRPEFFGEAVLD